MEKIYAKHAILNFLNYLEQITQFRFIQKLWITCKLTNCYQKLLIWSFFQLISCLSSDLQIINWVI